MSNYLLVHGGGEGGWCWFKVKKILEKMGHNVITPDLPGHEVHSQIPTTEITFDRYVRHIIDIIKSVDGWIVIVGHSMGGAVITKAINDIQNNKIEKAFYVCAILPQNGDSINSILREDTSSELKKTVRLIREKQSVELIPEMIDEIIFNECSTEDIQYAKDRIVLQSMMPWSTPITLENNSYLKRIGIICRKDKSLSPDLQEKMYLKANCEIRYLDAGHAPFFSKAEELSQILMTN